MRLVRPSAWRLTSQEMPRRPGRFGPNCVETVRTSPRSGHTSACWNVPVVRKPAAWLFAWSASVFLACGGAAADHEALGDRAYVSRQFNDALIEYRLAIKQHSSPKLRAKAGAAALHVGDLGEAASQYVALAKESNERRDE